MKKALTKDLVKEILSSKKRFISIILIVMLGVGFYSGIRMATPSMQYTADKYYDNQNFMDFRLVSEYGITKENIEKIEKEKNIKSIMPSYSKDVIAHKDDIDKLEQVIKVHSLPQDTREDNDSYINRLIVQEGRLPKKEDEIVVDKKIVDKLEKSIGDTIYLNDEEYLSHKYYKIVGIVESPLYISVERGSTSLGSGTVLGFAYIMESGIKLDIYTDVFVTVENATNKICYSDAYTDVIRPVEERLEKLGAKLGKERYDELIDEATEKLDDGKNKLNEAKVEKETQEKDAREKLENSKREIEKAEKQILSNEKKANTEFANADKKIKESENKIIESQNTLNLEKKKLEEESKKIENIIKEIKSGIAQIDERLKTVNFNLENIVGEIKSKEKDLDNINKEIKDIDDELVNREINIQRITNEILDLESQLALDITEEEKVQIRLEIDKKQKEIERLQSLDSQKSTLESNKITLTNDINVLKPQKESLEIVKTQLENEKTPLEKQLVDINSKLEEGKLQIESAEKQIIEARGILNLEKSNLTVLKRNTYSKLTSAKADLVDAKKKLENGEKDFEIEIEKANEKIHEAEKELIDAEEKISEIKEPEWYILNRRKNAGYEEYRENSIKIDAIAKVFPIVFFVVAALVCLTSMTRMVEEQRMQIGTLKALGYKNINIINKYIIYALVATLLGCIIGINVGMNFLPKVIANAYAIMYALPEVEIPTNFEIPVTTSLIAIIIIILATVYACKQELACMPSVLMRPKSPKIGKRIWLEKIPFIWNKMNFTKKVTARNMFRYKKRFFMTIIGIAGCTALVVTGFGVKDSVSALVPKQFNKIFNYNAQIRIKEKITEKESRELDDLLEETNKFKEYNKIRMSSNEIKKGDVQREIYLVVPDSNEILQNQIKLQNRKTKEKIDLNDNTVIITEKLAKVINAKVGSEFEIHLSDNNRINVKVGGITENYVGHYVYMTKNMYKRLSKEEIHYNVIYATTKKMTEEMQTELSTKILKSENVLSFDYLSKTKIDLENTFDSLNRIVTILIVAASLLALVVLYNLNNINISERIRELATIKVLGFYDEEISEYIHRESVILTRIGIVLGLVLGYILEAFIIKTCEVDMIMFQPDIKLTSYIFAVLVTLVCTWLVNIIVYFSLKKINMIESLKSVE